MPPARKAATQLPVKLFKTPAAWSAWLVKNADGSKGLWLRFAKKTAALTSITHDQALEVALCHGWIDGQAQSLDADSWLQKFTPRGPRSIWSKINRAKALQLINDRKMHPAGLVAIERAKATGRWEAAYDSHRTSEPPPEFLAALKRSPKAKAFFATLNAQNRYAILFRLQTVKREETRQRKIVQFVAMLERGEKLHP